jgi:rare lipoprotein A
MRKLVMGCAVACLIAMAPKSEAKLPVSPGPLPMVQQEIPKGEIGLASWYGIERQGKPTASGEAFDKDKLTAAHRKLPFGTTVRVTNLKNLESTLLRINDRGPGIQGRVIDVSWAAASKLGFLEAGLARVEIDVVSYPHGYVGHTTGPSSPKDN